jgi:chromosome segregation ATPase
MSFLNFLGFYSKQKANDLARDVTSSIVSLDPEGASEAQLNMMMDKLHEISVNVAKYRRAYEKDVQETEGWKERLNQTISAIEILQNDLDRTTSERDIRDIGDAIDSLLDEVEKIEVEIAREEAEDLEAKEILDTYEEAEKNLAEKIKVARENLRKLSSGIERAKARKEMAEERLRAEREKQGLDNSLDSLTIASDHMNRELERLENEESAIKSQAELLKDRNPFSGDSVVADALARAKGEAKSLSRADRLKKLRERRG